MNNNSIIQIKNLGKEYSHSGLKLQVLSNLTFDLGVRTFTSILAPHKSGKSVLLEIIAGLEEPSTGTIDNKSNIVSYIPSKPSSFPWLSVKENVEIANKFKGGEKFNITELIKLTGLSGYEDHFPNNKSLGFRLRISLARALASNPALILLDDPFYQMDQITKSEIYPLLRQIFLSTGISFLIATSNITEAVFLADRIIILKPESSGILEEITPELPEYRTQTILSEPVFKKKVKSIEDIIKVGDSLIFNSFLI